MLMVRSSLAGSGLFAAGISVALGIVALAPVVGCSATDDGVGFGGSGGSDTGGEGGEGGLLLGGGGPGGGTSTCTDIGCIGAAPQGGCDASLAMDSADGMDGARAIGLCADVATHGWGVTSARYVRSDGVDMNAPELAIGRGILDNFGTVAPLEGANMLVLSSGAARTPSDPGYESVGGLWKDFNPHGSPPGYPKESPSCPGIITGSPYDSAGLELVIKTPSDAKSLKFNLDFYTYEFPVYICSMFNDFFVALMTPQPMGSLDGNISFDSQNNLISVNAGFLQVCSPQSAGGKQFPCPLGPGELSGTGYDEQQGGSAATGWLETTAPIDTPGAEITLRFAIWDSGDGVLDSSVLVDNFRFEAQEGSTGTIPVPK
jgi:hypothetical protein